jgi:D-alanyl-D-alanine carboxypeptidase (penicillin-binding protein 5/6)
MVVVSGNDAANAAAEHLSGSRLRFVASMNRKAEEMGLRATRFGTASGLFRPEQTSSAAEMARLGLRLYKDFPSQRAWFGVRSFVFDGVVRLNTNNLLFRYPGCDGLKTGTTADLVCHLVASANRDGRALVGSVMGCPSRARRDQEMTALLDYGFSA